MSRMRGGLGLWLALVAVAAGTVLAVMHYRTGGNAKSTLPVATAARGDVVVDVGAVGRIVAANETAPVVVAAGQATATAASALLVGGIGIMNMMLVSVHERTREIGIRKSVGADPLRVQLQFLIEAVVLSTFGGLAGIAAGIASARLISAFAGWQTVVSPSQLLIAFSVALAVGLFFGFYPARRAARLDPIAALRYE